MFNDGFFKWFSEQIVSFIGSVVLYLIIELCRKMCCVIIVVFRLYFSLIEEIIKTWWCVKIWFLELCIMNVLFLIMWHYMNHITWLTSNSLSAKFGGLHMGPLYVFFVLIHAFAFNFCGFDKTNDSTKKKTCHLKSCCHGQLHSF